MNKERDKTKETPKLSVFKGKGIPDDFKENIADMKSKMPLLIENIFLIAQLTRAKYNALLNEGFTKEQALELCKKL